MNEEILNSRTRSVRLVQIISTLPRLSTEASYELQQISRRREFMSFDERQEELLRIEKRLALDWAKKGVTYCIDDIGETPVRCPEYPLCRDRYVDGSRTIVFPYPGPLRPRADSLWISEYTFQALHSRKPKAHTLITEDLELLERALLAYER